MRIGQVFLIYILFMLAMLILTLPVWIDSAIPILKDWINSTGETMESMWFSLQYIWERLTQDIANLLDKYV